MAESSFTLAVDNSQWYPLTVAGSGKTEVEVVEDDLAATQDLLLAKPSGGAGTESASAKRPGGVYFIFRPQGGRRYFQQNEFLGSVKTAAGSITLQQVEK